MVDQKHIQTLVEHTVNEVVIDSMPALCQQIAQRVIEKLAEQSPSELPIADSAILNAALVAVQAGTTQVQILDAMIDGAAHFAARTALFVVRGANAIGWRARGFADDEGLKTSPLELTEGLAAKALAARSPVNGLASEFLPGFAERFGSPKHPATVCPLVVRDKVVAVIYADGGTGDHHFDQPAMEALVRYTAMWLEVFATRKVSGAVTTAEPPLPPVPQPSQSMAAVAAGAYSAPMSSSFAPMAAAAPVVTAVAAPVAMMEPPPMIEAVPVPVPAPAPAVAPPTKEDEIHTKARRFAKLLVDEIRLYNQAKVSEGRQNHDLYDRLKDDIEKSRASYERRYGNTAAKEANYFNQELVRILADNDASLFGGNFPR